MDQLFWIMIFSLPCLILSVEHLVLLSVVGVALADTRVVPIQFIYYLRFVPMGILCFRILADPRLKRPLPKNSYYLVKVWTPFLAFALLSACYSSQPSISIQRGVSAIFVLAGFGIGIPLYFAHTRKMVRVLKLISIVMGGAILYSLFVAPSHESVLVNQEDYERLQGIFRNPNTLGLLAMQLIFVLIYFWQKRKEEFVGKFVLGASIAVGVAMVATGSRASGVGFTVGLLVLILGYTRVEKKTVSAVWSVLLVLVSIFLISGYFFPEYSGGLFRTDSAGRSLLWDWTWEAYKEGPFWGVGFGNNAEVFAREALYLKSKGLYAAEAHNSFLSLLLELGFIGVGLALYGFLTLVIRAWKCLPYFEDPKLGVALIAAILASLVNSIFETWIFNFGNASTVPFWLFLGIVSHQTVQAQLGVRYASIHMWGPNVSAYAKQQTVGTIGSGKSQYAHGNEEVSNSQVKLQNKVIRTQI
jgi:O-antigen ligase